MTSGSEPNNGAESRHRVRIGVFIPLGAQLLDTACIDIFASMSHEYMSLLSEMLPSAIINLAPSVSIYYISTLQPTQQIDLTANMKIQCTHHLSSPEVQPGKLDIVLIPGPDPSSVVDEESKKWLAAHAAVQSTDILSVCTGAYICGAAGILKGRKFCGPRSLQGDLKSKFGSQEVDWVGGELRWVRDGNIWSSGGVTNGNDLVAAYARQQSHHFPGPVAEMGLTFTDTGDRPQKYTTGKTVFSLGVVWQIIKAVFIGYGSKSKSS